MPTFEKFDPHAFLTGHGRPALAGLATLAAGEGGFAPADDAAEQQKSNPDQTLKSGDHEAAPAKVARAAKVQSPGTANAVLSPADCLELLTELHAELRSAYVEGGLPWAMANLPELARRFRDTEAAIDRLAGARPTEAEFRQALAAHAAVWRELIARYRASQERQAEHADPMPELPLDAVAAVRKL